MTITIIGEEHDNFSFQFIRKFVKNRKSNVCLLLEEEGIGKESNWQKYATEYYRFKKEEKQAYTHYVKLKSRKNDTIAFRKMFEAYKSSSIGTTFEWIKQREEAHNYNVKDNWPSLERRRGIIERLIDRENKVKIIDCDFRDVGLDKKNSRIKRLVTEDLHLKLGIHDDYCTELVFLYQIEKNLNDFDSILIFTGEHHKRILKKMLRYFGIPYEKSKQMDLDDHDRDMIREEKEDLEYAFDNLLKKENYSKEKLKEVLLKKVEGAIK